MKSLLKTLILWLLDVSGINAISRYINRDRAIILYYHGICDDTFNLLKGYDVRQLPKTIFTKQLTYLKRKGYNFVNMTELKNLITNNGKIYKSTVLTFDDGFKNVFEKAYPIMKEIGAKGCFYIVTSLIGQNQLLWTDYIDTLVRNQKKGIFKFLYKGTEIQYKLDDVQSYQYTIKDMVSKLRSISDKERLEHIAQFNEYKLESIPEEFSIITPGQITQLDQNVLEIGSHTRAHPNCTNLTSDTELEQEITNSKVELEKITGAAIKHFCYPAGSHDDRVVAKVIESGYDTAVTTKYGFNNKYSDLYRLKRIEASDQFLLFKASASGSYLLIQRIKDIILYPVKILRRIRP